MENEKVSVLIDAGLKRTEAIALLYLFEHNETVSRSIEKETDLRQPEVSNAMARFSERGWVSKKKSLESEGKGRPETTITLIKKKADIIEDLLEQLRQNNMRIKEALEKLDKLF